MFPAEAADTFDGAVDQVNTPARACWQTLHSTRLRQLWSIDEEAKANQGNTRFRRRLGGCIPSLCEIVVDSHRGVFFTYLFWLTVSDDLCLPSPVQLLSL